MLRTDASEHDVDNLDVELLRAQQPAFAHAARLCTSTRLYDFQAKRFVERTALLSIMGFAPEDLSLDAFTSTEISGLSGNGMTTTALVLVLLPILRAQGFL